MEAIRDAASTSDQVIIIPTTRLANVHKNSVHPVIAIRLNQSGASICSPASPTNFVFLKIHEIFTNFGARRNCLYLQIKYKRHPTYTMVTTKHAAINAPTTNITTASRSIIFSNANNATRIASHS
ncbi:hypothetical protein [Chitiniphilus shinanonensis]|uniref:hypothetical protein n=1 Tax=Chitiniphilus shinanonensis TaxID=553088 RepID=UPI0033414E3B